MTKIPMTSDLCTATKSTRVLLYSHDTFGLGHIRRCRTLANAITASDENATALILTGSPVAGRFTFPERVDHIRLPGVTKMTDGLLPSLEWLKSHRPNTQIVLGLRDVLDDPDVLAKEWDRKNALEAAEKFYNDIWVYGLKDIYDPTQGLALSDDAKSRIHWTGYLRRENVEEATPISEPYILVTPGGGGDGAAMVDHVLSAYESDPDLRPSAVLVYGPFLAGETRTAFEGRVQKLNGRVMSVGFNSRMESLMSGALGVVAMGGYNTFCEILSFDKPAIIIPRTIPRLEQYIRASRSEELGLIRMVHKERDGDTPSVMNAAIRNLRNQAPPSAGKIDGLLDGLDIVVKRTAALLAKAKLK